MSAPYASLDESEEAGTSLLTNDVKLEQPRPRFSKTSSLDWDEDLSPIERANPLSKLTFHYIQPLLNLGAQRPIKAEDLPPLPRADRAEEIAEKLQDAWDESSQKGSFGLSSFFILMLAYFLFALLIRSYFYLLDALWVAFGFEYMLAGIPALISTACSLAQPLIASLVISHVKDMATATEPVSTEDILYGVGLVFFAFLLQLTGGVCEHFYYFYLERMGMRITNSLSVLVYRKSLKMSQVSSGNANNLLMADPPMVGGLTWLVHPAWRYPLRIILALVALYRWLGWPSLVGIAVMAILGPLNGWVSKRMTVAETRIMKFRDARVKSLTEILQGVQIVKLFAWEPQMSARVEKVRAEEVSELKAYAYLMAAMTFLSALFSSIVSTTVLSVYAGLGNALTAETVFPSLVLLESLTWPVLWLPSIIGGSVEAVVSVKRLNEFLRRPELKLEEREADKPGEEYALEMKDAILRHHPIDKDIGDEEEGEAGAEEPEKEAAEVQLKESTSSLGSSTSIAKDFQLEIPSFFVRRGELVAIIGRVGSGKSSLLSGLLGELQREEGRVVTRGSVGYVSQQAWIRNATVRDNIIFGREFNQEWYTKVVEACALKEDFNILPAGDLTEIGEKGVNLSGGQKQRVSLARAAYANLDVYLFDDPLSAVDAHVGKHLFDQCILKLLKGKTRVLVTHQLQFLPRVDRLFVLDKGSLQQQGTYKDIMEKGVDFAALLQESREEEDGDLKSSGARKKPEDLLEATLSPSEQRKGGDKMDAGDEEKKGEKDEADGKLVEEEEHITGQVDVSVYKNYLLSVGSVVLIVLLLVLAVTFEAGDLAQRKWLSVWSDGAIDPDPGLTFYLGIYLGIALLETASAFVRQFLWAKAALDAAKLMHDKLLDSILRAPMSFFHATPVGRIINRFSKDQSSVDQHLPDMMSDFIMCVLSVIFLPLLIAFTAPWFIAAIIPIFVIYYVVQRFFRNTSRELGRLSSISSSPIFAQYNETLGGLAVIRAYRAESLLMDENSALVNNNGRATFQNYSAFRWLGSRVEAIGALTGLAVGLIAVLGGNHMSAGAVGLTLSLASSVTGSLNWFIRSFTMVESNMNNVERIFQMSAVKPEAPRIIESKRAPRGWPNEGKVEFRSLYLRYRDDQDPVLKGVTFTIRAREKVGVVGRTGAGKSSLTNALFRITEPYQGSIVIDEVDTSALGLHDVRGNLSIIPQEPVLFSGTVRSNLDPFNSYPDSDLWSVLDRVHMKRYVRSVPQRLDAPITENGSNLSVGQRQLLCIGRALVRDPKILVMDEATASVDNETDALIQQTVRTEFKDKTVITIAHRLNTIMDSDRVLVMDKGKVVEFDTPKGLLANPGGFFSRLVENTGKGAAAKLKTMANKNNNSNPIAVNSLIDMDIIADDGQGGFASLIETRPGHF